MPRREGVSRRQFVVGAGVAAAAAAGATSGGASGSDPGESGAWLSGTVLANDGESLRVRLFTGGERSLGLGSGAQPTLEGPVALTEFVPGVELVATGSWSRDGSFVAETLEGLYRVADARVTDRSGSRLHTSAGDIELSQRTVPRSGRALGHDVEGRAPGAVSAGDHIVAMGRIDPATGDLAAVLLGAVDS
jgi:hypothetical protein